jgi:hypothetical protein
MGMFHQPDIAEFARRSIFSLKPMTVITNAFRDGLGFTAVAPRGALDP